MSKIDYYKNLDSVKDFIQKHASEDDNLDFTFNAKVTYNNHTLTNESIFSKVRISIESNDTYVRILHKEDRNLFTSEFRGKFQDFELLNNGNLQTKGTHNSNPDVGSYTVDISYIRN